MQQKLNRRHTKTLKNYIQRGFVLNDELIKNGRPFGKDYKETNWKFNSIIITKGIDCFQSIPFVNLIV